ncbi:MAG: tyrosine-protein phosphatase [Micromonosporaceae bacterium]
MTRHLEWSGCRNVRDLGGIPVRGGRTTRHGALVRAESLHRLDPDGVRAVTEHGVGTILDLRSDWELGDDTHPFASSDRYRRIPWIDPVRDAERDPDAERTLADLYQGSLDRNTSQIATIVRAIAEAPVGAVVVHCRAGKDRTGLLVALLLDLVGVPREEIAADYAASEHRLGLPDGAALPDDGPAVPDDRVDAFWRTERQTILTALEHVDHRHGGTRRYLLGSGVTALILDRLAGRLVSG